MLTKASTRTVISLRWRWPMVAVGALLALAACSGGDDDVPTAEAGPVTTVVGAGVTTTQPVSAEAPTSTSPADTVAPYVYSITGAMPDGTTEAVEVSLWPAVRAGEYVAPSGWPAVAACDVDLQRDAVIRATSRITNTTPGGFAAKVEFALYSGYDPRFSAVGHYSSGDQCSPVNGAMFFYTASDDVIAPGVSFDTNFVVVVADYFTPAAPDGDPSQMPPVSTSLERYMFDVTVDGPGASSAAKLIPLPVPGSGNPLPSSSSSSSSAAAPTTTFAISKTTEAPAPPEPSSSSQTALRDIAETAVCPPFDVFSAPLGEEVGWSDVEVTEDGMVICTYGRTDSIIDRVGVLRVYEDGRGWFEVARDQYGRSTEVTSVDGLGDAASKMDWFGPNVIVSSGGYVGWVVVDALDHPIDDAVAVARSVLAGAASSSRDVVEGTIDIRQVACDGSTDGQVGFDEHGTAYMCVAGAGWIVGEDS